MSDRMVSVNEADLRAVLDAGWGRLSSTEAMSMVHPPRGASPVTRLQAALDALGPEPCGHHVGAEVRCVLPTGHHDHLSADCWASCDMLADDPIHCGDAHVPPTDVWSTDD